MIRSAEVYLWGSRIGYLYQRDNEDYPKFEYDKAFINSGIEVSPFIMPLGDTVYSFPSLMKTDAFRGLPGLVADSLPDRFGNAVIEKWLAAQGRSIDSFTPIERLCYTGTRGMGALEYVPSSSPQFQNNDIDINEMVSLASDILTDKSSIELSGKMASLQQLMSIGSSAGGARPKAVVAINEKTGKIKSGQIDAGDGYDYWLLKFDGVTNAGDYGVTDPKQFTKIEYAYYLMAKDADITMSECKLLEKEGRFHFMTKRFDRIGCEKIHMQTLAALAHYDYNIPRLCSYEKYADISKRLGLGLGDIKQIYKRMVFSVLACNCDDHVKNFSYLMNRNGDWSLSPAYDITFAYNPTNKWLSEHQMTINNKSTGISCEDLIQSGKAMGLPVDFCKKTIRAISIIVNNWPVYADRCNIDEERAESINNILNITNSTI